MNTQTSFYIAVLSISMVVAAPFIWFPCGESESEESGRPLGNVDVPTCEPSSSFEIQFDQATCSIQLNDISSSSCEIEASADGGVSWVTLQNGDALGLTGSGACDVKLRSAENPEMVVSYSGTQICNCTPQVNTAVIEDLVDDPLNHFLDGQECRCSDFTFVFPDGIRISAIEISLYLKMNRLNGVEFEVEEVDLENQEVLLINR
jgi:hypothetical protein